ncbi:MAG: DNA polymerase [Nitrosotalea sp.]
MLINLDAKALEWICAVYLCQDPIAIKELKNNEDIHTNNQDAFTLPSRLIAKTFIFRMIFGGSAWSYANDPEFSGISDNPKYWQKVIDKTYDKYKGLAKWHTKIQQEVSLTGRLEMPTGRVYSYQRRLGWNGDMQWPVTTILNYPVQGLGADLLTIIRISLHKRMRKANLNGLFVCTVHDSILIDCKKEEVNETCDLIFKVFDDLPKNFEKIYGVPFNLRLGVEIQVGMDWKNMIDYKRK